MAVLSDSARALIDGKSFAGLVSIYGSNQHPGWRIENGALTK